MDMKSSNNALFSKYIFNYYILNLMNFGMGAHYLICYNISKVFNKVTAFQDSKIFMNLQVRLYFIISKPRF
jgi:hypothetical protein